MKSRLLSPKSRGRPRAFDRQAALESAVDLFWERGYEATSVSELTEAMGIMPPSLYSAFGDKKRLYFEAVDHYQSGPGCFAKAAFEQEPTAKRTVRRLLLEAIGAFSQPDRPKGCMVILSAINCSAASHDVAEALADMRRAAENAIKDRLIAGRDLGEFPADTDLARLAKMVATFLYGLSLQARDGTSQSDLNALVDLFMKIWPGK